MEINTIQNLLTEVSAIKKQYDKIADITGENFNVFKILDLKTHELSHSAFLTELLNAKGSHGQGDIFLKLFCEELGISNFNYSNSNAKKELHISQISEDKNEGGNIDIIIKDDANNAIIIENKIYASDQEKQLLRYKNYGDKYHKGKYYLLYLTLDGKDASEWSKSNLNENDFKKISYSDFILRWLELCNKETVNHPLLRETIRQYVYLIKELTHQTMNEEMKNEIIKTILSNGNNISASIEISKSLYDAKKKVLTIFAERIQNFFSGEEIIIEVSKDFSDKFQGINFKLTVESKEYIMLSFLSDMKDFYFEIVNEKNQGGAERKDKTTLGFYEKKLKVVTSQWGIVEDVNNAWHGDWVCRYKKLDKFFIDSFWADIVFDNENSKNVIREVCNDVIELLNVLKEKQNNN